MPGWFRFDDVRNVLCISVHVQPNARTTGITGKHGEALKIRVAAPPLDQRANRVLIDFIAQKLGVPSTNVGVVRGLKSRSKLVEVFGPGERALRSLSDWEV